MKNTVATVTTPATRKTLVKKENQERSRLTVGQEVKVYQPAVWLVYDENGAPVFGVKENWFKTVITTVNHDPDDWFVRVEKGAQLSPDWNQDEFSLEEIEFTDGEIRLKAIID